MNFNNTEAFKLIYVFRINDTAHQGCLKIGDATVHSDNWDLKPNSKLLNEAAKKRINGYTQTAAIEYDLLYTEIAVYKKKIRSSPSEIQLCMNCCKGQDRIGKSLGFVPSPLRINKS